MFSFLFIVVATVAVLWKFKQEIFKVSNSDKAQLGSGEMFNAIAPYYDTANKVMSLGLDQSWRRRLMQTVAQDIGEGSSIMDMSTGTGDVAILLAEQLKDKGWSNFKVFGIDPSIEMLKYADEKAMTAELLDYVQFSVGDAQNLETIDYDSFDIITMSFGIRNVMNRSTALHQMRNVIRPEGVLAIMEFTLPVKGFLAPVTYFFVSYVVPLLGAIVSLGKAREYVHLRDSVISFPSAPDFLQELTRAGFKNCEQRNIFYDLVYIFFCRGKET